MRQEKNEKNEEIYFNYFYLIEINNEDHKNLE